MKDLFGCNLQFVLYVCVCGHAHIYFFLLRTKLLSLVSLCDCMYLLKQREVTAALSEAQQQGQDVDGAGRLLRLLRARQSRISLGHAKLLSYWRKCECTHIFYLLLTADTD